MVDQSDYMVRIEREGDFCARLKLRSAIRKW